MIDTYDPARNSFGSWSLAIAAAREEGVRSGSYAPLTDDKRRQAAEGPRAWSDLDCLRGRS